MNYKTEFFNDIKVTELPEAPLSALNPVCLQAAEEGAVLLKNEGVLPIKEGEKVAVFGNAALSYIKSGTGSGGRVRPPYLTDIPTELGKLRELYTEPLDYYKEWKGGLTDKDFAIWDRIPWCIPEANMPEEIIERSAENADVAVMVIGRYAGENRDNGAEAGSYYLTDEEDRLMGLLCRHFKRVAILLNVGNVMDMSWVEKHDPGAVMYVWQGGQEGGRAVANLLCGIANPSGKLTDTIAHKITDYPSDKYFYDDAVTYYGEDIYVGYRYFETFAPEKVLYPFGYGLSYTKFKTNLECTYEDSGYITVSVKVENVGDMAGKEVIALYYGAPQGYLGKSAKSLCAFAKTELLEPGMSEIILLTFEVDAMASFDDSGVTGEKNCFLLEAGDYPIYMGTDVRSATLVYTHNEPELRVISRHEEVLTPVKPFDRLHPVVNGDIIEEAYEPTPLRTYDYHARILAEMPADPEYTGDKGIKLADVAEGKATLDDFIAQLSDYQLTLLCKGEGMNSPKVQTGTGCAYAGHTDELRDYGIPVVCGTDGPSGVRMEGGGLSTSIPVGTQLACTWNTDLMEQLHELLGVEAFAYKIDTLLSPGINIHRHPLNGRNFEYYSEDPFLTGKFAAAACRGFESCGLTMTVKHFICNNRETNRYNLDSIVSARAIREIYAKGFEMAVKEGGARAIMTSYNPVNGIWTASNYDLCTKLLRDDWGYDGFVMTDWWAGCNDDNNEPDYMAWSYMVRAQNDVYMVCADAVLATDDLMKALSDGRITRGQLARCVKNLLRYVLRTPALVREARGENIRLLGLAEKADELTTIVEKDEVKSGDVFVLERDHKGVVLLSVTYSCDGPKLAQIPVSFMVGNSTAVTLAVTNTEEQTLTLMRETNLPPNPHCKLVFPDTVKIDKIVIKE